MRFFTRSNNTLLFTMKPPLPFQIEKCLTFIFIYLGFIDLISDGSKKMTANMELRLN